MSSSASRRSAATALLMSLAFAGAASPGAQAQALQPAPKAPSKAAAGPASGGCAAPAQARRSARPVAAGPGAAQDKPQPAPEVNRVRADSDKGGAATKTTIASDALQSSNSQNTYDAIKNVPGVAPADARGGSTADSLQIRGIKLSSTTSYRLDGGLPIVNNINLPIEDKCRIEALKGAGALEFGIASPAGIINYVFKRAGAVPNASIALSTNGYGQAVQAIDVGRRFGTSNQFGARINLAGGEIGSFVHGAGGTRYLAAFAGDWNASNRASLQLDYEEFGIDVVEQAALLELKPVNGRIPIPRIPDPSKLLSGSWARSIGVGRNVFVRGEYAFDGGLTFMAEAGRSEGRRPQRNLTQIGSYDLVTGQGKLTGTLVQDQDTVNVYHNVQVKHRSQSRAFANEFTFGVNRNERDFNNPQNPTVTYNQNLYDPVTLPAPVAPAGRVYQPNNSHDLDYYFSDTLHVADRLHIFGGLRQIQYQSDAHLAKGAVSQTNTSTLAPGAGLIYDVSRQVSLYASYVASLEETGQAPVNSVNAFQVLPPARATQREVGIRATGIRGVSGTLGYFTVDRGNATIDQATNVYALNGTTTYQGLEATANVRLHPRLSLNAGGQLMRAVQNAAGDPTINGKPPENTPNFSDNVSLSYRPAFARGLTLNGGMLYIGKRQINPQNQGMIPGVTTSTFGAAYLSRPGDHRFSFNLTCTNLFDKRYYSSAVNGALGVGPPRTVTLSTRLEL
ncbi:MAG: TonB-dependent siderophore receptor [Candidatus Eremiobacteraeota bacterium]|nr:TonB-dependent siderophore receptor [Candidatus Eremiobacteraeota bacterium]